MAMPLVAVRTLSETLSDKTVERTPFGDAVLVNVLTPGVLHLA